MAGAFWLLADFTYVCTTEFAAFAKRNNVFKKLIAKLFGLSINSVFLISMDLVDKRKIKRKNSFPNNYRRYGKSCRKTRYGSPR